jgi:hypothetical protein
VRKAEVIVFLGFGFHQQNLELVRPEDPSDAKRVFATALGISKSDCEVVKIQIQRLLGQGPERFGIDLRNDLTCPGLFNEFWRSLSLG